MGDAIKAMGANLERLERVASPAPWVASSAICCPDRGTVSVLEHGHTQPSHAFSTWDAELVAAARNALPALLAELKRLWAVEQKQELDVTHTYLRNRVQELEGKLAIATKNCASMTMRLAAAEAVCARVDAKRKRQSPLFDPMMNELIGEWIKTKETP